jgi:hypothetical protein
MTTMTTQTSYWVEDGHRSTEFAVVFDTLYSHHVRVASRGVSRDGGRPTAGQWAEVDALLAGAGVERGEALYRHGGRQYDRVRVSGAGEVTLDRFTTDPRVDNRVTVPAPGLGAALLALAAGFAGTCLRAR